MVALSLASGVVSPRTAFIGVDQESGPIAHAEHDIFYRLHNCSLIDTVGLLSILLEYLYVFIYSCDASFSLEVSPEGMTLAEESPIYCVLRIPPCLLSPPFPVVFLSLANSSTLFTHLSGGLPCTPDHIVSLLCSFFPKSLHLQFTPLSGGLLLTPYPVVSQSYTFFPKLFIFSRTS